MEQIQVTATHEFVFNCSLAPDTILQGRYRIVRQLGRGGMGAVYEAVDERLGISVALKETFSSETHMRKQFEHEARLLASMQHPALPRVSDHFVEADRAFLVMQFIGGMDLAKIIAQQPGPLPREQVIAWADQLLDALIYLHTRDRQVIHRDIKPHNLKLTSTGQIALLDFGLARAQSSQASDASITSSQAFFGYTRHYAPLEQIQDQRTDPRTDIYALGATLYHLLTGIKPPDAMVRATALLHSEPDPLTPADKIHEAVGPEIAAILNKAMAQKAQDRYADANEFREAFRRMGRAKQADMKKEAGELVSRIDDRASKVRISSARSGDHTAVNMAMVESARRFGPASMTAVFLALITMGVVALYGAQQWLPGRVPAATSASASVQRQPAVTSKADRPRTSESTGVSIAKPPSINNVETTEPNRKSAMAIESKATAVSRTPGNYNLKQRKGRGRIGAPSIRLPNPEFRNNAPEPSPESRYRTYTSSGARPRAYSDPGIRRYSSASLTPKFFRASDGTQIVKFSGGLTRVVRPGERSARAEASYR
jgi:serine/threonine protein kinase